MSKSPELGTNEPTHTYKYVELTLSRKNKTPVVGFEIVDGKLNLFLAENIIRGAITESPISPKKARKFARALLALADQVAPPAPEFRYYQSTLIASLYWRLADGGSPEVWADHPSERVWRKPLDGIDIVDRIRNGASVREITPDALPPAARP